MTKEDFIRACNVTIEKKEKEIEFLKNFVHSVECMDDATFESIPFSIDSINTTEITNKQVKKKEEKLDLIDWDEWNWCLETGQCYSEDKKVLLSTIGLVSKCKGDFIDKLHIYGYGCIEDLMFNWKTRCDMNYIDLQLVTDKVNYSLSDVVMFYYALNKVKGLKITNYDKYGINYDKYNTITSKHPEYSEISIDDVLNNVITDCSKQVKGLARNTLHRSGIRSVLDLLIIDDLKKFAKDADGWGNGVTRCANCIIEKYDV